jgi:hypothetical protein
LFALETGHGFQRQLDPPRGRHDLGESVCTGRGVSPRTKGLSDSAAAWLDIQITATTVKKNLLRNLVHITHISGIKIKGLELLPALQ